MNKKTGLILGLILSVAFFLRFWNLGIGDLVTDEAKTALGIAYPHSFVLPNLSVLSQSIFGVSEWAVRLPFALMGIMTVWLWYLIGTKLKNQNFGLVLAGLAAVIPTNVIFSRSAYLDAPVILVWLVALFFWVITEQESEQTWGKFGLWFFLLLAPFIKLQAVYLHVVLGLIILWQTRGKFWQDTRTWLIVISVLPITGYVLGQPQQMYDIFAYFFQQSSGVKIDSSLSLFAGTVGFWLWPFLVLTMIGLWTPRKILFSSKNIFLPFLGVGLVALIFSILGTRQLYYLAMIDPLLVLGAGLGIWYLVEKWKYLTMVSSLIIIGWSGFIIFSVSNITKNFCVQVQNGCYWQSATTSEWIRKVQGEKDIVYYLDENLGYTPKWRLPFETKKLDSLPNLSEKRTNSLVLIVGRGSKVAKFAGLTNEVSGGVVKVLLIKAVDKIAPLN